jgi:hypothetical protein
MKNSLVSFKSNAKFMVSICENLEDSTDRLLEVFTLSEHKKIVEDISREIRLDCYFLYKLFYDWEGLSFWSKFFKLYSKKVNDINPLERTKIIRI